MAVNKDKVKIHVTDLKKNFGKLKVLDGISIDVYEGEVVVVIGPSGSGKSTFLRSLNLLEDATSGKVFFEDVDITEIAIQLSSAELTYEAALMATGKVMQTTLLNFI